MSEESCMLYAVKEYEKALQSNADDPIITAVAKYAVNTSEKCPSPAYIWVKLLDMRWLKLVERKLGK